MKKVLIITYHWPPAGGPGVQRVLKFAKYLPEFGWQPLILTVKNGEYLAIDTSQENNISPDIRVFRTNTLEPYSLYKRLLRKKQDYIIPNLILTEKEKTSFRDKLAKWIRTNLFIPDARIGWYPYIVNTGKNIIKEEKPDLIFSTSPPHSVQIGAMRLSRISGLPWIADFRDPWYDLGIFYNHNQRNYFSDSLDAKFERKVVRNASAIITNNHFAAELYAKGNRKLEDFFILPNGFDSEDFMDLEEREPEYFTITHSGTLSDNRMPEALLQAIVRVKDSSHVPIRLHLIGTISARFIDMLHKYELYNDTQISEYMTFGKALSQLKSSSAVLLVNVKGPHAEVFIPAKLFDYLGVKKPIFAIGPPHGAAAEIINNTNSGKMVEHDDFEGAYQLLTDMISDWKSKTTRFSFDSEQYEKRRLTKKLAGFFDQIAG